MHSFHPRDFMPPKKNLAQKTMKKLEASKKKIAAATAAQRRERKRQKRTAQEEERLTELAKPEEERTFKKRNRPGPHSATYNPKPQPDEAVSFFSGTLPTRTELGTHIEKKEIWHPPPIPNPIKPNPHFAGSGRRKSARVAAYIKTPGTGKITVNGRNYVDYFKHIYTRGQLLAPLVASERIGLCDVILTARGGGFSGQAEAAQRAIAHAFINGDPEMLYLFREAGMQFGDVRRKERKHTGFRKARKKQAWVKR